MPSWGLEWFVLSFADYSGNLFYCFFFVSAGLQDLRGAGAVTLLASGEKTLLVWEEESLLDPKPRRTSPKEQTLLAPEAPTYLQLKPQSLLSWKVHLSRPALLDPRARTPSAHQNWRGRPAPCPTNRTTPLLRTPPKVLHVPKDPAPLRLKGRNHRRASQTPLSWGASKSLTRVRTPPKCPDPPTPRSPSPPTNIRLPRSRRRKRWSAGAQRPSASWRRPCRRGRKPRRSCRRWRSCRARRWGGSAGGPTRRWPHRRPRLCWPPPPPRRMTTRPPRRPPPRTRTNPRRLDDGSPPFDAPLSFWIFSVEVATLLKFCTKQD